MLSTFMSRGWAYLGKFFGAPALTGPFDVESLLSNTGNGAYSRGSLG